MTQINAKKQQSTLVAYPIHQQRSPGMDSSIHTGCQQMSPNSVVGHPVGYFKSHPEDDAGMIHNNSPDAVSCSIMQGTSCSSLDQVSPSIHPNEYHNSPNHCSPVYAQIPPPGMGSSDEKLLKDEPRFDPQATSCIETTSICTQMGGGNMMDSTSNSHSQTMGYNYNTVSSAECMMTSSQGSFADYGEYILASNESTVPTGMHGYQSCMGETRTDGPKQTPVMYGENSATHEGIVSPLDYSATHGHPHCDSLSMMQKVPANHPAFLPLRRVSSSSSTNSVWNQSSSPSLPPGTTLDGSMSHLGHQKMSSQHHQGRSSSQYHQTDNNSGSCHMQSSPTVANTNFMSHISSPIDSHTSPSRVAQMSPKASSSPVTQYDSAHKSLDNTNRMPPTIPAVKTEQMSPVAHQVPKHINQGFSPNFDGPLPARKGSNPNIADMNAPSNTALASQQQYSGFYSAEMNPEAGTGSEASLNYRMAGNQTTLHQHRGHFSATVAPNAFSPQYSGINFPEMMASATPSNPGSMSSPSNLATVVGSMNSFEFDNSENQGTTSNMFSHGTHSHRHHPYQSAAATHHLTGSPYSHNNPHQYSHISPAIYNHHQGVWPNTFSSITRQ